MLHSSRLWIAITDSSAGAGTGTAAAAAAAPSDAAISVSRTPNDRFSREEWALHAVLSLSLSRSGDWRAGGAEATSPIRPYLIRSCCRSVLTHRTSAHPSIRSGRSVAAATLLRFHRRRAAAARLW
uniref:Uncharacterized protein n=1 Tax=Arundo donax TaxID=35708 RepID=A0A0A9DZW4_ARUDO